MLDVIEKNELKTGVPPSKKWRNKWHCGKITVYSDGSTRDVGDFFGDLIWPSKEVAEQKALELLDKWKEWVKIFDHRYLGAFPE